MKEMDVLGRIRCMRAGPGGGNECFGKNSYYEGKTRWIK